MTSTLRVSIVFGLIFSAVLVLSTQPCRAAGSKSLGDLTGAWQLFVDDYLVAAKNHVVRTYHPFEKYRGNPIMLGDKPWEGGDIYLYGTILPTKDGSGYRMWYQTIPGGDEVSSVLYATSKDGIHWDKPNLGIHERKGSTDNNIVFPDKGGSFMASVMHTPWDPDPQRRYKLMRFGKGGWAAACSADGIHWTDLPGNPVCKGGGDSAQFAWDPLMKRYLGYGKVIRHVDGMRRRCVGFAATRELAKWPKLEVVMAPDTFDDRWASGVERTHFYGVSAFAYESMYIGLLWIFRATDPEGYLVGPLFVELVTSHDGVHWRREEGERPPILALGKPGTWDDGMILTPNHPLVEGDTIRLYYGGFDEEHSCPMHGKIGLATLRKDGFASLDAGDKPGEILTKRIRGTSGPLRVNYNAKGGWLKVEVLDAEGKVQPGYSRTECDALQGDSVNQQVTWSGRKKLPAQAGPLRLRFIMKNASVYSFMAGDSIEVIDEPAGPVLAALYTFEGSSGDQWTTDGAQSLHLHGDIRINNQPEHVAFGSRSVPLGSRFSPLCTLEIEGTRSLGTQFTLAAMAKFAKNKHARLFSSYGSCGPVKGTELVFDCDPTGKAMAGLRLICKGIAVDSQPVTFADGKYHHLAVVYDDGLVTFYLDGEQAGQDRVPGGDPVLLMRNLFVGEDAEVGADEQFRGHMDDILVLGRALSAEEVKTLSEKGADALPGLPDRAS